MRKVLFFILWSVGICGQAQLQIDYCRSGAMANYPLVNRYGLIKQAEHYNLSNIQKANLPQFSLSGKATYQNDVTKMPVTLPGVEVERLNKDQYQAMVELKQSLWDGGETGAKKQLTRAGTGVTYEQQKVDMYALGSRVNDLFFGILLLDEQLKANQLLSDDLERNLKLVRSLYHNGMAGQSDVDAVVAEQLDVERKNIALQASREAYVRMLSLFIGEELKSDVVVQKPAPILVAHDDSVSRPELDVLAAQHRELQAQRKALNVGLHPRLSVFAQGLYGNPGLNMLENKFAFNVLAGIRFSWNFGALYTRKTDRRLIDNAGEQLNVRRDVFLFNTRQSIVRQQGEATAIARQLQTDDEIIRLRQNIRKAAEAKVENGTLTVTEMLRELTRESLARLTRAQHEIELLKNMYEQRETMGRK